MNISLDDERDAISDLTSFQVICLEINITILMFCK